jgi:carbon dioxide concentrating mechanism protein CcmN
MSLPILQPRTTPTIQVRGDVSIDDSAIVADGVILNATEGSKIIIHAGVCLGMGCIITAFPATTIEIKANAILGAGCLVFGACVIGNQVSLGSAVTIYNTDIEPLSVIPSGTVRGDRSRSVTIDSEPVAKKQVDQETKSHTTSSKEELSDAAKREKHINSYKNLHKPSNMTPTQEQIPADSQGNTNQDQNLDNTLQINTDDDPWNIKSDSPKQVVGQVYINKLLLTLFPEKNNPL